MMSPIPTRVVTQSLNFPWTDLLFPRSMSLFASFHEGSHVGDGAQCQRAAAKLKCMMERRQRGRSEQARQRHTTESGNLLGERPTQTTAPASNRAERRPGRKRERERSSSSSGNKFRISSTQHRIPNGPSTAQGRPSLPPSSSFSTSYLACCRLLTNAAPIQSTSRPFAPVSRLLAHS